MQNVGDLGFVYVEDSAFRVRGEVCKSRYCSSDCRD